MPQRSKKPKKNKVDTYHHGDLRKVLTAEARAIVEREGPDKVSLRAVAKAAGVSQAAPYHHFKDKQALLAAVAADGFRAFTAAMIDRGKDADEPITRLRRLGVGYVEFAVRHPQLFRLMQGPTFQSDDIDPELDDARAKSAEPLIAAVSACLPEADEAQIMTACAGAWSIVHGMATLSNDGRLATLIDISDLEATAFAITGQLDVETGLR